ncbi:hypothetical protein M4I32_03760 [Microbacterium sp. LRZ72]|uniref:hypothetical protein n=1 Tax=Microbacterium sp. LRZ72 TaxID=2942481 RepID=UPI0029B9CD7E|nr:hypothetical protein [Microbacterium sp. LRZ72]MDX2375912.1 hypothetical protein [Microbacterium sp. LRZ72]
MSSSDADAAGPRQRIVRVPGARRAKLTPAPGATGEPRGSENEPKAVPPASGSGPNDERLRQDVPPHY